MYTLKGYGDMIVDRIRIEAYVQALRQTVRPGSVVVDIGTDLASWRFWHASLALAASSPLNRVPSFR